MKRKYNEFYIGLSVIITIIIVIAIILYLEKNNFLESGITVNMVLQNAEGIKTGGDVAYRGLDVGSVVDTKITTRGIVLMLKITKIDSIPDNSKFLLSTPNLIGSRTVEIVPGKSSSYLKNGAYVTGSSSAGFSDIIHGVDNVTSNMKRVIKNVGSLANDKTRNELRIALNGIDESVNLIHRSLKNNLADIHQTVENMKQITTDNKAPIDSIVNRLSVHSKNISIAMENLEVITKNLKTITENINAGKGTAGKLLTNDELYNKINNTVTNLNNLIKDIEKHPERYVHVTLF